MHGHGHPACPAHRRARPRRSPWRLAQFMYPSARACGASMRDHRGHREPPSAPTRCPLPLHMRAKAAKSSKVAARRQRDWILGIRRRARPQQCGSRCCHARRAAAATAELHSFDVGSPSDPRCPRGAEWGTQSDQPSSMPLTAVGMPPGGYAQLIRLPPLPLPPMPSPHRQSGRLLARGGCQITRKSHAATSNAVAKCCRASATLISRDYAPARRASAAFVGERSPCRADCCPCPHASCHRPPCTRTLQPQQLDLDRAPRPEPCRRCLSTMP